MKTHMEFDQHGHPLRCDKCGAWEHSTIEHEQLAESNPDYRILERLWAEQKFRQKTQKN